MRFFLKFLQSKVQGNAQIAVHAEIEIPALEEEFRVPAFAAAQFEHLERGRRSECLDEILKVRPWVGIEVVRAGRRVCRTLTVCQTGRLRT